MTVAVLFARADSFYKSLPGCDVWDEKRDARKWPGGAPVVAHPPCRLWGRLHTFARAKNVEEEKGLALFAVGQIRKFGGVLEHPKDSKLWKVAGLPKPMAAPDQYGGFTVEVHQGWWGHRAPKPTWLYVVGLKEALPEMPRQMPLTFGRIELMCTREREATPPAFAKWLVYVANKCRMDGEFVK